MSDPEDDALDEKELREAEALARALSRGSADEHLPDEALQTAALIRYSADGGLLRKEREEAILDALLEAVERAPKRSRERTSVPFWRWLFGLGAVAAVAIALLIVLRPRDLQATALPAPDLSLLRAQTERLQSEDDEAFETEMQRYRGSVYAALTERYEER
jgi:hypothetical protein